MLEEPALSVEPVPVRYRVEGKKERLVVHALGTQREGPMQIGSIEQADCVGIE